MLFRLFLAFFFLSTYAADFSDLWICSNGSVFREVESHIRGCNCTHARMSNLVANPTNKTIAVCRSPRCVYRHFEGKKAMCYTPYYGYMFVVFANIVDHDRVQCTHCGSQSHRCKFSTHLRHSACGDFYFQEHMKALEKEAAEALLSLMDQEGGT